MFAELILHNANIFGHNVPEHADAIAVKEGKIVRIGSLSELTDLMFKDTYYIDVKGRSVIPCFIDAHSHLIKKGMQMGWLDLSDVHSLEEFKKRLIKATEKVPRGEWILGNNWDESMWEEVRYPTRSELDDAVPEYPIFLKRIDGHMALINSKGIEELGLSSNIPHFDERNGFLKEDAVGKAEDALLGKMDTVIEGVKNAVKLAKQHGTVSFHDTVNANLIKGLQIALRQGYLDINAYLLVWHTLMDHLLELGLLQGFGEGMEIGAIKSMVDGSIGARTAALRDAYSDDASSSGKVLLTKEELIEMFTKGNEAGMQLATHAIGDRALDLVFDVFSNIPVREELRHRIEHFEMARAEHVQKAAAKGIVASMQPNFVAKWQMPGGLYDKRLGKERRKFMNPFKKFLQKKVPLAFGSDCMPFGPMYGLYGAISHPNEESRLSITEAIQAYTYGGAYAAHQEGRRGSIEEGKLADFAVLSRNPLKVEKDDLLDISVIATFIRGELSYNPYDLTRTKRK